MKEEKVKWSTGRTAELGVGLSPGVDSLRTSTQARGVAAHSWSTSAEAGRPLHWWPATPGRAAEEEIKGGIYVNNRSSADSQKFKTQVLHTHNSQKLKRQILSVKCSDELGFLNCKLDRALAAWTTTKQRLFHFSLHFSPQETVSAMHSCRGTWKQFTFLVTFFLIPRFESEGWLFQRRKKRLLGVLYKGRPVPFKRTITNGIDMLLAKTNEVSLERHSSSSKKACLLCCNTWGQLGLVSSFIINDILEPFSIQQTHAHQTAQKSLPSTSTHYLHWNRGDHVEDKVIPSAIRACPLSTSFEVAPVFGATRYASEESNIAGLCYHYFV